MTPAQALFTSLAHLNFGFPRSLGRLRRPGTETLQHHGTEEIPPPPKEVLSRQGEECVGSHNSADSHRALEIGGLSGSGSVKMTSAGSAQG